MDDPMRRFTKALVSLTVIAVVGVAIHYIAGVTARGSGPYSKSALSTCAVCHSRSLAD